MHVAVQMWVDSIFLNGMMCCYNIICRPINMYTMKANPCVKLLASLFRIAVRSGDCPSAPGAWEQKVVFHSIYTGTAFFLVILLFPMMAGIIYIQKQHDSTIISQKVTFNRRMFSAVSTCFGLFSGVWPL